MTHKPRAVDLLNAKHDPVHKELPPPIKAKFRIKPPSEDVDTWRRGYVTGVLAMFILWIISIALSALWEKL